MSTQGLTGSALSLPTPSRRSASIVRTSLLLLPAHILMRAAEACLPILIGVLFGRSGDTDFYYFAAAEFALIGALVFDLYRDSALIPILTRIARGQGAPGETVAKVTGALAGHTLLWGGLLSIVAGAIVAVTAPGAVVGESPRLAPLLVAALAPHLVFMSLRSLFAATLNAHGRYLASALPGALGSSCALAVIWLGAKSGAGIAVVGGALLAGELLALGPMLWAVSRTLKEPLRLTLERPPAVRRFARLVASEVMGGAVVRVNPLVDQLMAGWVGLVGGGTLLKLSSDIALAPTALLQAVLFPVLLTELARRTDHGGAAHRRTVVRALVTVVALLSVASLVMVLLRRPLVRLLFGHGAMDVEGLETLAHVLIFQVAGLAPFGALLVLARAHVSLGNSRIMFVMGLLNVGLNLAFNVALAPKLGLAGLALSTSLVHLGVAIAMGVQLRGWYQRQPAVVA